MESLSPFKTKNYLDQVSSTNYHVCPRHGPLCW